MGTVKKLAAVVWVYLGDGTVRLEAGERLEYAADGANGNGTNGGTSPRWETWSAPPEKKPARALAVHNPGKLWYFVGDDDVGECVEGRGIDVDELDPGIVVFREGLSMPKGELVRVVNTAHAVLALRGAEEYFYLREDFVLSARDEEALMEWGLGRPLFANSLLAVGGTLLVFFAESLWRPGVVGTLLVAAAGYRVQGALTKVLRVWSPAWTDNLLVPSGIHGAERVVQGVLVTIVALADLLDNRVLLLTALVLASAQVVVLESVGQAALTWGFKTYRSILGAQLGAWAFVCAGMVAFVWVVYVFAGFFGCVPCEFVALFVLGYGLSWAKNHFHWDEDRGAVYMERFFYINSLGVNVVAIWAAVEGWDEADLKYSWRSLQPWRWPLLRAPDSFFTGLRVIGLWFGAIVAFGFAGYVVVGLLSFRISSDTDAKKSRGEKTRARKVSGNFVHYHDEKSIPSRKLLEIQPQPDVAAPVASVV